MISTFIAGALAVSLASFAMWRKARPTVQQRKEAADFVNWALHREGFNWNLTRKEWEDTIHSYETDRGLGLSREAIEEVLEELGV